MQPQRFGDYILLRKIATGGTAEIFLARREGAEGFARHIAIKRILPQLATETAFVQLLLDEARLAAHLHHGHVVQIHDVGDVDGQAYIAMEYLPGTDVGRLLQKARKRTRRVLVAHPEDHVRPVWLAALKRLGRRIELVPAMDADELSRTADAGPVDLAIIDSRLDSKVIDQLASRHPELLRVLVVGPSDEPLELPIVYPVANADPEHIAQVADGCLAAPMPMDLAVQIIRAVLDGLDHAHCAVDYQDRPLRIVHRDVNPSNVLVSTTGTVKLVDFGIARAATTAEGRRKGFVGTYHYMSPEQTAGEPVDARTDLFSLGTLMHELIAGRHPYKSDDMFSTMRAVREDIPPRLDAIVPGVPDQLVQICCLAEQKSPESRYATAEAMLIDLENFVRRAAMNLSPKRLAGFIRVLFGDEVKRFGVTTSSMPAVRLDDKGQPILPSKAGSPIQGRSSASAIVERASAHRAVGRDQVERPPPTSMAQALAESSPGPGLLAAEPFSPAVGPSPSLSPPGSMPAFTGTSSPGVLSGAGRVGVRDRSSVDRQPRQLGDALPRFADMGTAPPLVPPSDTMEAIPGLVDEEGPTIMAPPPPEVLAALAEHPLNYSPEPPRRDARAISEPPAPAEHIARRLRHARVAETPRASLHGDGAPPPVRERPRDDRAVQAVLIAVIIALIALAGLYLWWRSSTTSDSAGHPLPTIEKVLPG